jgi:hypothetical protein
MSTNHIDFYRYYRPYDHQRCHVKSDQGVTAFVRIDYESRLVAASFSVCNGDNFNKVVGQQLAYDRFQKREFIIFTLEEFIDSGLSIREYLYWLLNTVKSANIVCLELLLKQMRSS